MQSSEFSLNGYRFKRYNESNYVLIFHQKYPSGGLFTSESECNRSLKISWVEWLKKCNFGEKKSLYGLSPPQKKQMGFKAMFL